MKIKSISDLPGALFYPLKTWAEASTGNFNILVGTGSLLTILSILLLWYFYKKIGPEDERTDQVYLKATTLMFLAVVFCDILFPREYMANIFFMFKYSISLFVGGFYLAWRYKKDFS